MVKLPKDFVRMARVGYICSVWANFEATVAHAIWAMLGLKGDIGRIVTGGLDMRPRLNMAVRLAEKLKMPADFTEALVDARKAIDDGLDVRRNLIVHGIHIYRESADEPWMLDLHRGKQTQPQAFTDEDLDKLSNDLTEAYYDLSKRLSASMRRHPIMAAQMRATTSETPSEAEPQSDRT